MAPTTARLVYNLVNKGPRGGMDKVNYYVVGFLGWQTHPGLVIKHTRGGRAESAELNQESAPFGQQLALHSTRPARSHDWFRYDPDSLVLNVEVFGILYSTYLGFEKYECYRLSVKEIVLWLFR